MRTASLVALSGIALVNVAAAACCRGNRCLKAVVSAGQDAIADCSAALVVTVTPSTSTVTQTITSVDSVVATAMATETTTDTVSTETDVSTESATVTATTDTIVITQTTVIPVTVTTVQTVATVTTPIFSYQTFYKKARRTASPGSPSPLPLFASAACHSWDNFVNACKCAGVEASTVTASAPVETVTVPAASALTSIVSTVSATVTDIVSVTASTLATESVILSLTESATSTLTDDVTTTTAVVQSATATVPGYTCLPVGTQFQIYQVRDTPGLPLLTMYLEENDVDNVGKVLDWTAYPSSGLSGTQLYPYTFVLDSNGYLELANTIGSDTDVLAPFINLDTEGWPDTLLISMASKSVVESAAAIGEFARIQGCVDPQNGRLRLLGGGRMNILTCAGELNLASGDGSDSPSPCTTVMPFVTQLPDGF